MVRALLDGGKTQTRRILKPKRGVTLGDFSVDMGARGIGRAFALPPKWPGPLFYPPINMIAVMTTGARIHVWPNESETDGDFTGLMLRDGTPARRVVFDLSCMWSRTMISHIERPTDADRSLMLDEEP